MPGKRTFCTILIFLISLINTYHCSAQVLSMPNNSDSLDSARVIDAPVRNSTFVISSDHSCIIFVDGISYGIVKADETINVKVQQGEHKVVAKSIDSTEIYYKQNMSIAENASRVIDIELNVKHDKPANVAAPAINAIGTNFTKQSFVPKMVYVAGDTFTMGCTAEQTDCWENEKPTHKVKVSSYYIAAYELTLAQFKQFIDSSGYKTDAEKSGWSYVRVGSSWVKMDSVDWRCGVAGLTRPESEWNHPVIHVSWNDAKAYCDWLSKVTGKKYRLPTEAEWEFASRGGTKTEGNRFSGASKPGDVGWYADNSSASTHAVGLKSPNELGLYDMSGNVWEWCSDWDGNYAADSLSNPTGATTGTNKILRGGSWLSFYWSVRTTNRNNYDPASSCTVNGFRVVMEE